eukprot:tig00021590_g22776.t1
MDALRRALEEAGLDASVAHKYAQIFVEQEVMVDDLPMLTRDMMSEMGIKVIGHQIKIQKAAATVSERQLAKSAKQKPEGAPSTAGLDVLRNPTKATLADRGTRGDDDPGASISPSTARPATVAVTPASVNSLRRSQQQHQARAAQDALPSSAGDLAAFEEPSSVPLPPPVASASMPDVGAFESSESVSRFFESSGEPVGEDVLEESEERPPERLAEGDEWLSMADAEEVLYEGEGEEDLFAAGREEEEPRASQKPARRSIAAASAGPQAPAAAAVPLDAASHADFFALKDELEAALKLEGPALKEAVVPILAQLRDTSVPKDVVKGTNLVEMLDPMLKHPDRELDNLCRAVVRKYVDGPVLGRATRPRSPLPEPSPRRRAPAPAAPTAAAGKPGAAAAASPLPEGDEAAARAAHRKALANALDDRVPGMTKQVEEAATAIEAEAWRVAGGDRARYAERLVALQGALRDPRFKELPWSVARGTTAPAKLAALSDAELEELGRSLEESRAPVRRDRRPGRPSPPRKRPLSPVSDTAPHPPPPRSPSPPVRGDRSPSPARKRIALPFPGASGGFSSGPPRPVGRSPPRAGPVGRSPRRSPARGRSPPRFGPGRLPSPRRVIAARRAAAGPPHLPAAAGSIRLRAAPGSLLPARRPPRFAASRGPPGSPPRGGRPGSPPRGVRPGSPPRASRPGSPPRGNRLASPPRGGRPSPPRGGRPSPPRGGRPGSPPRGGRPSPPAGLDPPRPAWRPALLASPRQTEPAPREPAAVAAGEGRHLAGGGAGRRSPSPPPRLLPDDPRVRAARLEAEEAVRRLGFGSAAAPPAPPQPAAPSTAALASAPAPAARPQPRSVVSVPGTTSPPRGGASGPGAAGGGGPAAAAGAGERERKRSWAKGKGSDEEVSGFRDAPREGPARPHPMDPLAPHPRDLPGPRPARDGPRDRDGLQERGGFRERGGGPREWEPPPRERDGPRNFEGRGGRQPQGGRHGQHAALDPRVLAQPWAQCKQCHEPATHYEEGLNDKRGNQPGTKFQCVPCNKFWWGAPLRP